MSNSKKNPATDNNVIEMLNRCVQQLMNISSGPMTVSQWAERWLPIALAGKGSRQQQSIKNAIINHVLPIIGCLDLTQVRSSDAKAVMASVSDCSSSLCTKVLSNMRALFDAACEDHLIIENPCSGIKAGGKQTLEKSALTYDQQTALEMAVKGTRAETFVLLGLYAGLRREEILALRWKQLKLDCNPPYLSVRSAIRWEHNQPVLSDELKSAAAYRTIPIPDVLVRHLKNLPVSGDFVIGGKKPLSEMQFKNLWKIVKRRTVRDQEPVGTKAPNSHVVRTLDFHVTPHILRHTYVTRLILSGANIKDVQYLAGHSDQRITLRIYTHLIDRSPSVLVKAVNMAFGHLDN